jgi:hypothetical protein
MKQYLILFILGLSTLNSFAGETEDSIAVERFQTEIDNEQKYIIANIEGYDTIFFQKLDYLQVNLRRKNYSFQSKRKYFANLLNFIHIIATSTDAKEKFKSGFYMEALEFFPSIVAYSEAGELEKLLAAYPAKTLKSIPILFNEKALKTVLYEIAMKDPDVFFKYLYELFTLPYIRKYVEDVAVYAPVSAKKYIFSPNYVSYYLESSTVPAVKILYDIKKERGASGKSYILTNQIINEGISIAEAENICFTKETLIKKLLQTIISPNQIGTYSINKEIELQSLLTLRDYRVNGYPAISHLNNKELLLTLIYGGKELTTESVNSINSMVKYKKAELISIQDLKFIPIRNVSHFINICDQFNQIDLLDKVFEPEAKEYLFSKMNFEQEVKYSLKNRDLLLPPFVSTPRKFQDSFNVSQVTKPIIKAADTLISPASAAIKKSATNEIGREVQLNNPNLQADKPSVNKEMIQSAEIIATNEVSNSLEAGKELNDGANNKNLSNDALGTNPLEKQEQLMAKNTKLTAEEKLEAKSEDLVQQPEALTKKVLEDTMQSAEDMHHSEKLVATKVETPSYNFPKIELKESDRQLLAWTKNLNQSIDNLADIIEQENGVAFLDYLCQNYPDEVFASINDIFRKNYCAKYVAKAALNAPNSAKRYLMNPANPVNMQLSVSRQPEVKAIYNIFSKYAMQSKSYYLIDEIVKQNQDIDKLHELAKDKILFIKKLSKILLGSSPYGKYSASKEMSYEALRIIRDINGAVETNSTGNIYEIVQQLTPEEIYTLMIYGQEELFRNSFNGIYSIFKSKLQENNALLFFEKVNYKKFRTFLNLCNTFDKWNDFVGFLNQGEQNQLIVKLVSNVDKEDDYINESIMLADLLQNMKNIEAKQKLHKALKKEFEKADLEKNKRAIAIYGLLASIIGDNAVSELAWYKSIANEYKLPPLSALNINDLKSDNGKIIEHCFFYDDEDGKSSYINFIANYKNQPDWIFEDYSTYVKISSRTGTPIEIYANKPDAEYTGQQAITALLKEKNLSPSIIIHRGHSYHTEKTIRQIINAPKFIFLGSCGGFYKISLALERAPNAQTLATKQIGSKSVNDPVFKSFNEELRKGNNINWRNFWGTMESRLASNSLFYDYVPPHKNISALFIRAYYYLVGI